MSLERELPSSTTSIHDDESPSSSSNNKTSLGPPSDTLLQLYNLSKSLGAALKLKSLEPQYDIVCKEHDLLTQSLVEVLQSREKLERELAHIQQKIDNLNSEIPTIRHEVSTSKTIRDELQKEIEELNSSAEGISSQKPLPHISLGELSSSSHPPNSKHKIKQRKGPGSVHGSPKTKGKKRPDSVMRKKKVTEFVIDRDRSEFLQFMSLFEESARAAIEYSINTKLIPNNPTCIASVLRHEKLSMSQVGDFLGGQ